MNETRGKREYKKRGNNKCMRFNYICVVQKMDGGVGKVIICIIGGLNGGWKII